MYQLTKDFRIEEEIDEGYGKVVYYNGIINMSGFQFIKNMESEVLFELKKKFDSEREQELINKKLEEKFFYEQNGFKSWEELVEYLKTTNKTLYSYGDTLSWNESTKQIKYYHQTSDGNDCNFWYTNEYFTEKEFFDWKHDVETRYPGISKNEYGYIKRWTK